VYPLTIDPYLITQTAILTASDKAPGAYFGNSVALYNDTIVVGAMDATPGSSYSNAGEAYVFKNIGGTWTPTQTLTASDKAASANFGTSVALYNDTIVVGAYNANSGYGKAYVFKNTGSGWNQMGSPLTGSDISQPAYFGGAVSVYNDTIAVGARNKQNSIPVCAGEAYVFKNIGGTWTPTQTLPSPDPSEIGGFAFSISIYNDTIVAGAPAVTVSSYGNAGEAYVYQNTGSVWNLVGSLTASDKAASAAFGNPVTLYNDTIVVGAVGATPGGITNAGEAYVFKNTGSSWNQVGSPLTASDNTIKAYFGSAVSISNDTIVVGAYNATPGSGYTSAGEAYVFKNTGSVWNQVGSPLTASDKATSANFGSWASVYNNTMVIGAQGANTNAGEAYVFTAPVPTSTPTTAPQNSGGGDSDSGNVASSGSSASVASSPGAAAGKTMSFSYDSNSQNPILEITHVDIVPSQQVGQVDLLVQSVSLGAANQLTSTPEVVGYRQIEPVGVNPGVFSNAVISFQVSNAWITEHQVNPAQVTMLRNHDGVWSTLPTTYLGQNGNYYTYTATTPGFSYFAVAVRNDTAVAASPTAPAASVETTMTDAIPATSITTIPTTVRTTVPVTTETTAVPASAPAPAGSYGLPVGSIIIGAVAIVLVVVGVVFARRWLIRRQNPALFRKYN
jgi:PGF-pre-PGF domain-containing protein